jgi:hypothetical protein
MRFYLLIKPIKVGYYININTKGETLPVMNKSEALLKDGATLTDGNKFEDNLICVVSNGPVDSVTGASFDAAAFAYSEDEFEEFKRPDGRAKTWLIHPEAKKLAGYK